MNAVWGKLYGTVVILMMPAFAGDALCGSKSPHVSMRDDELPVVKNMEREAPGDGSYIPFSISVDGETVGRSEVAAVKGSRLSASDTGQEDVKSIGLLRRLDPDDYYPIYGDDSSFVEDAPTKGKLYVRLERGDNRVMWGNYRRASPTQSSCLPSAAFIATSLGGM